jgi:hypothetical protein
MVMVKSEAVESWRRYAVAVADAFQLRVVFNDTFLELSAGAESVGARGAEAPVVKLLTCDHGLVP